MLLMVVVVTCVNSNARVENSVKVSTSLWSKLSTLFRSKLEHMIPEMDEHLKPEHKHHNINAK